MNHPQAKPNPNCDACDGVGLIYYDHQGEAIPQDASDPTSRTLPCRCVTEQGRRAHLEKVLRPLPPNLRHVGLERWPVAVMRADQVEPIRDYVERVAGHVRAQQGLWIHGDSRAGKSTLAAVAYLAAANQRMSVAFHRLSRLLKQVRTTSFGEDALMSELEWEEKLATVDLLVLDDVGGSSTWGIGELYDILAEREAQTHGGLIVTTRFSVEDLNEQLGDHVVARMRALTPIEVECAHDPAISEPPDLQVVAASGEAV